MGIIGIHNVPPMKLILAILLSTSGLAAAAPKPVKVFILAGQSNMEGQAVVDLKGKDYNDRKGTLAAAHGGPGEGADVQASAEAPTAGGRCATTCGCAISARTGRCSRGRSGIGFSVYGDAHHFGPELQFGHVVGNHFENQVLLIKTAWGGKSLFKDFRPPSSGGEVGPYYTKMIAEIREALANLKKEFPGCDGNGFELAGFVVVSRME